jgi:hypothetical protein
MSIAKAIQLRIGRFHLPWTPHTDAALGRAFNELVISEESDHGPSDRIQSHFEIYLEAMDEVGADSSTVRKAVSLIDGGASIEEAMERAATPLSARKFVTSTLEFARRPIHESVAAFCLGREEILPGITKSLLHGIPDQDPKLAIFRWYLKRHIELDSTSHGPVTAALFRSVTGTNATLRAEALTAGLEAIHARYDYLTSIANAIRENSDQNENNLLSGADSVRGGNS